MAVIGFFNYIADHPNTKRLAQQMADEYFAAARARDHSVIQHGVLALQDKWREHDGLVLHVDSPEWSGTVHGTTYVDIADLVKIFDRPTLVFSRGTDHLRRLRSAFGNESQITYVTPEFGVPASDAILRWIERTGLD